MKRSGTASLVAILLAGLLGCTSVVSAGAGRQAGPTPRSGSDSGRTPDVATRYLPSDENFFNPERGFYRPSTPFWIGTQRLPLNDRALATFREEGVSLIRAYFLIDEFLNAPPQFGVNRGFFRFYHETRLAIHSEKCKSKNALPKNQEG